MWFHLGSYGFLQPSRIQCDALNCVMVDLYGRGRLVDSILREATSPLELFTHFDKVGYERHYVAEYDVFRITGGPRRRLFFQDADSAPTLNKTPLVKWRPYYLLIHSCHVMWPFHLNREGERKATGLSGALLHLTLSCYFISKILEERERNEVTVEYRAYNGLAEVMCFENNISAVYDDWRSLQKHGLLSDGGFAELP